MEEAGRQQWQEHLNSCEGGKSCGGGWLRWWAAVERSNVDSRPLITVDRCQDERNIEERRGGRQQVCRDGKDGQGDGGARGGGRMEGWKGEGG